VRLLTDGPADARVTFAFAQGAGGAMDTPFMTRMARGLGERGIRVVRFEFPYMAARREDGRRGAPDRQPVLLQCFRDVVQELGGRVAVGGKSMGGRMASMIADEVRAPALVCLGYPFHPPGKPTQLRTAHLETLRTPALVVQGTRDPFGTPEEVADYPLSPAIRFEWLPDGDHSLKPRKASGVTETDNFERAMSVISAFLMTCSKED
jgi:hypothetical protein